MTNLMKKPLPGILSIWCLIGALSYFTGMIASQRLPDSHKDALAQSHSAPDLLPLQLPSLDLELVNLRLAPSAQSETNPEGPSLGMLLQRDPLMLASACKVVESLSVDEIRDILVADSTHRDLLTRSPLMRLLLAGQWMHLDPETALAHDCGDDSLTRLLMDGWVGSDPDRGIRRSGNAGAMSLMVALVRPQLMMETILSHPEIEWTSTQLAVLADRDPEAFTMAARQQDCKWLGNAPLEILATDDPEQIWEWVERDEAFLCWNYSAMVTWSAGKDLEGALATLKRQTSRREPIQIGWRNETPDLIDLVIDGLFKAQPDTPLEPLVEHIPTAELADYDGFTDDWKRRRLGMETLEVDTPTETTGSSEQLRFMFESIVKKDSLPDDLMELIDSKTFPIDAEAAVALAKEQAIELTASMKSDDEAFRRQWFEDGWFEPLLDALPFAAIQPVTLSEHGDDYLAAVSTGGAGYRYCKRVARLDPVGLADWINRSASDRAIRLEVRELAARILCRETMEQAPEWAFTWAAALPRQSDRSQLTAMAIQTLLNRSDHPLPSDLRRMIDASDLTDGERRVLLGMIDGL
ncbi:MAG: hypothetical protein R3F19_31465 [Verrucomicrobiales bacterium]